MELPKTIKRLNSPIMNPIRIMLWKNLDDKVAIRKANGNYNWDKWSGTAFVTLECGDQATVELHWYQFEDIMKEIKIKQIF